jgi:uncharacterized cupin superfamily protein
MSGGYGLFHPGGRLPAHYHDIDESISIIDGVATCVVEGRRHALSGCETALVPRGRVHYFINDSAGTMAMLWVYAGPRRRRGLRHSGGQPLALRQAHRWPSVGLGHRWACPRAPSIMCSVGPTDRAARPGMTRS